MILQMRGISSCLEFSLRCSLYRPSGQNRRRRPESVRPGRDSAIGWQN